MGNLSSIFFSPVIFIELFIELFLLIILLYASVQATFIIKNYKQDSISDIKSYVEKKSYLLGVLVPIALFVKILLVAFFTYGLDSLSEVVPGAMCVTGVLNTNEYGSFIIILKLIVLLLSSLWIVLNKQDLQSTQGAFFLKKMKLFLLLFFLLIFEFVIVILFLSNIDTQLPVSCCSTKIIDQLNPLPFGINEISLLSLFYGFYFLVLLSAYKQTRLVLGMSTLLFAYFSYYAVTYYFSSYIYEIPLHHCPYCMLQEEYYFFGYFLYASFFIFIFYSASSSIFKVEAKNFIKVIVWATIFVAIITGTILK